MVTRWVSRGAQPTGYGIPDLGHEPDFAGRNPLALSTGAASGPARYWISDFAASACLLPKPIAAVKLVMLLNSPGNGPTSCAPATDTISEAWATPISASCLA